jgi:GT2 family glycosyltransferase
MAMPLAPRDPGDLSSGPPLPFVSVVVVNYNGKAYLEDCLRALRAQTYPADRREVILVDNGSADGSAAFVRERFPEVRVLELTSNRGFAGGNNAGIQAARGECIALLNNDTQVERRWLEALVEALQRDARAGGVASKILLKAEPGTLQSAGLNLYRDGRGGDRGFRQVDQGQFDQASEVFGACGASVLLRRALLDDVGLLDERFFVYYEDLDLAWRARLRGWRFWYAPNSVVHHVHCGTSGEWSPFFLYHVERNRVFVSLKNAPSRLALRSVAVFAARAARKWWRVLTRREATWHDLLQAWAYVPAGLSLVVWTPEMLWKRFLIRIWSRRVPDQVLAPHITAKP